MHRAEGKSSFCHSMRRHDTPTKLFSGTLFQKLASINRSQVIACFDRTLESRAIRDHLRTGCHTNIARKCAHVHFPQICVPIKQYGTVHLVIRGGLNRRGKEPNCLPNYANNFLNTVMLENGSDPDIAIVQPHFEPCSTLHSLNSYQNVNTNLVCVLMPNS